MMDLNQIYNIDALEGLKHRKCLNCGKPFIQKSHTKGIFCSYDCYIKYHTHIYRCLNCGKEFKSGKGRAKWGRGKTCSRKCQYQYLKKIRPHKLIQKKCLNCGKIFFKNPSTLNAKKGIGKYCSRKCRDIHWKGINNPNYLTGGNDYRGSNWQSQKRKARKRDNYTCQNCGYVSKTINVHHIIPYRYFNNNYLKANNIDNLICLCPKCHREADAEINKYDR